MSAPWCDVCGVCGAGTNGEALVYLATRPPYRYSDTQWSVSLCSEHGDAIRKLVKDMREIYADSLNPPTQGP
jgi:hypothetical protein